jgi:hypothetical protein
LICRRNGAQIVELFFRFSLLRSLTRLRKQLLESPARWRKGEQEHAERDAKMGEEACQRVSSLCVLGIMEIRTVESALEAATAVDRTGVAGGEKGGG